MNNDLISREALKKTFENLASDDYNEPIWYQKTVFETIDNAPPVAEDYDTGYQDGLEDGLNDIRPQGKWKLIKDNGNNIHAECPFCKFQIKCIAYNYSIWEVKQFIKNGDYDFEFPNFCENCGAEMKGAVE